MYSGPVGVVVHLVAGLFGVGFLWHAASVARQRRAMTDPDAERIGDVTDGDAVALDGTVQAKANESGGAETVTAPLGGGECVFAAWRVEEFIGHELGEHSGWTEQASGYVTTPFELTDASGEITVEVVGEREVLGTEFDLADLDSPRKSVPVEADLPPEIQQFETAHDVPERTPADPAPPSSESGPTQGDRRYYVGTIETGDSLFVAGTATRSDRGSCAVSDETGESLLLSDSGREGATGERAGRAAVTGLVGVVLLWYTLQPAL
ncbi:hypothetical protein M0R89_06175 [Halorussus limi]|uniref:Uncharacterized protein n=1 Tax=Halorussus limi TaxID=2938695 RepID=A0A8U0HXM0_9EURY|nr:hypothetical protein [Halorussus limi]UPV75648.1 hypothetical protein M0R89_06175 [Halorussus limi]